MSSSNARTSDFAVLQKEYRLMEMNRKAFAEESHAVLRKQQGSLEKLRADNEALKAELAMEMRSHARPSDLAGQRKDALKLRDEIEQYTELVAQEKRTMTVTTEQVALMKQKILHTRKTMGGVNVARENQAMIQKQVRILENRLEKALVKFNEALAHNKRLRDDIDDLRRERVVFDSIYQKLDRVRVRVCARTSVPLLFPAVVHIPQPLRFHTRQLPRVFLLICRSCTTRKSKWRTSSSFRTCPTKAATTSKWTSPPSSRYL